MTSGRVSTQTHPRPSGGSLLCRRPEAASRGRWRRARALHALRPAARPGALRAGLDILQGTDLREQVAGIGVPTVLIHGEGDAVVAPAAARWLVGTMPTAALHVVADAGHMPFLCEADRVTDLVARAMHG